MLDSAWLALVIGNSRLHWAWFIGEKLQQTWDTPHLPASVVQQLANCQTIANFPKEILYPSNLSPQPPDKIKPFPLPFPSSEGLGVDRKGEFGSPPPLYLASVVPSQTILWQAYPNVNLITLDKIPLLNAYPTLGCDRALALSGAGETYGFPILVIDAGTALTFTGADGNRTLVGGAILPGLGLQLQSLAQKTANLPQVEAQNVSLPPRWALNTPESIQSGIIYTITAGMRDFIEAWLQEFPESHICLTGGDGNLLLKYMRSHSPQVAARIMFEPHLIFWGMRKVRREE